MLYFISLDTRPHRKLQMCALFNRSACSTFRSLLFAPYPSLPARDNAFYQFLRQFSFSTSVFEQLSRFFFFNVTCISHTIQNKIKIIKITVKNTCFTPCFSPPKNIFLYPVRTVLDIIPESNPFLYKTLTLPTIRGHLPFLTFLNDLNVQNILTNISDNSKLSRIITIPFTRYISPLHRKRLLFKKKKERFSSILYFNPVNTHTVVYNE